MPKLCQIVVTNVQPCIQRPKLRPICSTGQNITALSNSVKRSPSDRQWKRNCTNETATNICTFARDEDQRGSRFIVRIPRRGNGQIGHKAAFQRDTICHGVISRGTGRTHANNATNHDPMLYSRVFFQAFTLQPRLLISRHVSSDVRLLLSLTIVK